MRIVIDTLGEEAVARTLTRLEGRLIDVAGAEPNLAAEMRSQTQAQFDSEGAAGSGGWAPLAESTIASKRSRGLDMRILHATGALRRSLTIMGARDSVTRTVGDVFEFGTTVPYAKWHQHGTSRMPRRRPVQLPERGRRQVVRILQQHVMSESA